MYTVDARAQRERSKIIAHQKSLLRGDINIREFEIELRKLRCTPENIFIKLDEVRQILKNQFNIDMEKERA